MSLARNTRRLGDQKPSIKRIPVFPGEVKHENGDTQRKHGGNVDEKKISYAFVAVKPGVLVFTGMPWITLNLVDPSRPLFDLRFRFDELLKTIGRAWRYLKALWFESDYYRLWEKMLLKIKRIVYWVVFNVPEAVKEAGGRVRGTGYRGQEEALRVTNVGAVVHATVEHKGSPLKRDWYIFYTNKLDPLTPNHEVYMPKFIKNFMDPENTDWQEFRRQVESDLASPWHNTVLAQVRELEAEEKLAQDQESGVTIEVFEHPGLWAGLKQSLERRTAEWSEGLQVPAWSHPSFTIPFVFPYVSGLTISLSAEGQASVKFVVREAPRQTVAAQTDAARMVHASVTTESKLTDAAWLEYWKKKLAENDEKLATELAERAVGESRIVDTWHERANFQAMLLVETGKDPASPWQKVLEKIQELESNNMMVSRRLWP